MSWMVPGDGLEEAFTPTSTSGDVYDDPCANGGCVLAPAETSESAADDFGVGSWYNPLAPNETYTYADPCADGGCVLEPSGSWAVADSTSLIASLTNTGFSIVKMFMQQGLSQEEATRRVLQQYQNDKTVVQIQEKMPGWTWIALGVGGVAILGLLGVIAFKKK